MQYSVALRNARLQADEDTVGTAPLLQILTGSAPASCAAAETGSELVQVVLPSDWQAAAASGSATKLGTWAEDVTAGGKAGYFRLYDSGDTTCHMQGLCSMPWVTSTAFEVGDQVDNGSGLTYICTTAGTSASAPTGTGTGISDGTVVWDYLGTTDLILQNTDLAVDQPLTINTFTRTVGGA